MIKVEANTLQEAFSRAASELSCSVTEIDIEVIQHPSSGFLGMFKKTAIIQAKRSNEKNEVKQNQKYHRENRDNKEQTERPQREDKRRSRNNRKNRNKHTDDKKEQKTHQEPKEQKAVAPVAPAPVKKEEPKKEIVRDVAKTIFDDAFHKPKVDIKEAILEIRENINKLFIHSCFELEVIKVDVFDENTVLLEFSGEDSALLIGKEGYRYKALSYLLYNWINLKYNLNIRLEIAEFLKNQEEMIDKYLVSVIERVNNNGRAQTKILDGVLVKIALEALRKEFPSKYVGIKSGRDGGKFIVTNDFNRKNS
jgi:spoIIIJ-associated protein